MSGGFTSRPNVTTAAGTGMFPNQTLASGTGPRATGNSSRIGYLLTVEQRKDEHRQAERRQDTPSDTTSPASSSPTSLTSLATSVEDASNTTANTDGSTYVNLTDSTGRYTLSAGSDGNFHVVAAGAADSTTLFQSYDNILLSDISGRLMRFYPDTMAAFNVSRFRISTPDDWPAPSDMVSLVPVDYDNEAATPAVYVASDTLSNYYYTVLCNLQGLESKIFIVADPVAGVEVLKRQDLQNILTGGVVEECSTIAFLSSGAGF